jgi:tRNA A-37 threonylcarbamoyl transferase component Bud32
MPKIIYNYLFKKIDKIWIDIEKKFNFKQKNLINLSYNNYTSRVYFKKKIIYKFKLNYNIYSNTNKTNNLRQEFIFLKKCNNLREIPKPIKYRSFKNFNVLMTEKKEGSEINLKVCLINPVILCKLFFLIFKLAKIRIAHNDLLPKNIIINKKYDLFLLDFDQAKEKSFLKSILSSLIDLSNNNLNMRRNKYNSIFNLFKFMLKKSLSNEFLIKCRKTFQPHYFKLPKNSNLKTLKSKKLNKAWSIAIKSNASAPGVSVAYYSFEFDGYHFPGERSWEDRWNILKKITNFKNKKILELGCNMSLLSCHILREFKNVKTTGIDNDKNIIQSAKIIADVMEVKPKYYVIDLDKGNWEKKFKNFDLVFCLNVLNWVKNKKKLLSFLGKFNELVFEGHDNYLVEKKRLSSIGFKNIKLICITERNRPLIYCVKN